MNVYLQLGFFLICTNTEDGLLRAKHAWVLTTRETNQVYLDDDVYLLSFFLFSWGGVRESFGTSATISPTVPTPDDR
jgi:hypothetical protein